MAALGLFNKQHLPLKEQKFSGLGYSWTCWSSGKLVFHSVCEVFVPEVLGKVAHIAVSSAWKTSQWAQPAAP